MKKVLSFLVIFTVLYLNANSIIELLPSSDFKMKLRLFIHKDKLENLIELADKTEYTHITWLKGELLKAGVREENQIIWDDSPDIDNIISKAESYDYNFIDLTKDKNNNWYLVGYTKTLFLKDSSTKTKNIRTEYSYGNTPKYEQCSKILISDIANGQCFVYLSENWFLHRYWVTIDINNEQT